MYEKRSSSSRALEGSVRQRAPWQGLDFRRTGCCILAASRRRIRARVLQRVYSHCQGTIFHYDINQNVPNILISKECVSVVDGATPCECRYSEEFEPCAKEW